MKANHSSNTKKVAVYSALFCLFLGAHPAFGAAEGVTITSDVHLPMATVGESAVVRVGAVNIEGSTINGNMTITSKARVGEISTDSSAQVNVASAHFNQARLQGNAKIELAARTANITVGQSSTVSVGGFEIDTKNEVDSFKQKISQSDVRMRPIEKKVLSVYQESKEYLVDIAPNTYLKYKYCLGLICEGRIFGRDKNGNGYFTSVRELGLGFGVQVAKGIETEIQEGREDKFGITDIQVDTGKVNLGMESAISYKSPNDWNPYLAVKAGSGPISVKADIFKPKVEFQGGLLTHF